MSDRPATCWWIAALLALLAGAWLSRGQAINGAPARPRWAEADARAIVAMVRMFRRTTGRMPTSLHELPASEALAFMGTFPRDPWDRDYELRGEAVVSAGPNGVFADGDDVSVPIRDR